MKQISKYHHRFVVFLPNYDIHLYHQPIEVYHAWDLHKIHHHYQNFGLKSTNTLPIDFGTRPVLKIPRNVSVFHDPAFAVVRPKSTLWSQYFNHENDFTHPMTRILNFIVRNGKSDPSRSDGYRVDIGCGGSAYEKKAGGNTWRPVQTYGLDELSNDPDFSVFKFFVGRIGDCVCKLSRRVSEINGKHHTPHPQRKREYSQVLRDALMAEDLDREQITLQLCNLSLNHSGAKHPDSKNDGRQGYNVCDVWVSPFITIFLLT